KKQHLRILTRQLRKTSRLDCRMGIDRLRIQVVDHNVGMKTADQLAGTGDCLIRFLCRAEPQDRPWRDLMHDLHHPITLVALIGTWARACKLCREYSLSCQPGVVQSTTRNDSHPDPLPLVTHLNQPFCVQPL